MADAVKEKRHKQLSGKMLVIMVLIFLFGLVGGFRYHDYYQENIVGQDLQMLSPADDAPQIAVHIVGAVSSPGLYWFDADARIDDALVSAGVLPAADKDLLNLAAFLVDGSKIVVPYQTNASEMESVVDEDIAKANDLFAQSSTGTTVLQNSTADVSGSGASQVAMVNINTASLSQLDTLPGIGPAKAQAIIDYRTSYGAFTAIDQITRVPGIGEATFENIKNYLSVD